MNRDEEILAELKAIRELLEKLDNSRYYVDDSNKIEYEVKGPKYEMKGEKWFTVNETKDSLGLDK